MANFWGFGLIALTFASGAVFTGAEAASAADECQGSSPMTCTFHVGRSEWTVPPGVTSITVDLYGAAGAAGSSGAAGGKGGHIRASLPVTPGEKFQINTGGRGRTDIYPRGGFNGGASGANVEAGAGGGASDLRIGGFTVNERVLVVGGGGGGATWSSFTIPKPTAGGDGGAAGDNAVGSNGGHIDVGGYHLEGYGGGTTGGGQAGLSDWGSLYYPGPPYSGSFAEGGYGFIAGWFLGGGGGGGGGWYGGGGGSIIAGGGGGSGHAVEAAQVVMSEKGVKLGDGLVTIKF